MLTKSIKKNLNIIFININICYFINYYLISDCYVQLYLRLFVNKKDLLNFFYFLKNSSFFNLNILLDIKCEDICLFSKKYRYKITYVFLSVYYNTRFFVTYFLYDFDELISIESLYSSAAFLEREIWDEFGVNFSFKNQNLNRRLLTDYGFKGHPLKKNYPLTGFYECVYNLEKTRIKTIPLCLVQEYRKFSFRPYRF